MGLNIASVGNSPSLALPLAFWPGSDNARSVIKDEADSFALISLPSPNLPNH